MNPKDIFEKLLGLTSEPDTSTWTKVTTLKPEDVTRSKTLEADRARIAGQSEVYIAKLHANKAEMSAMGKEWWEYLHNTYSLPRDRNYTIAEDGSILMEPKKSEEK